MENIRIDDLCYFVFGLTPEQIKSNKEKAIKTCISKSYLDMNRTINFLYSYSDLEKKDDNGNLIINEEDQKDFKNNKKTFKTDTEIIIYNAIENYSTFVENNSGNHKIPQECKIYFDKWHYILSTIIVDASQRTEKLFKSEEGIPYGITYGQAQKWINMTLKYMRIMGFSDFSDSFLHIPLDDYILTALKKKDKINDEFEIKGLDISTKSIDKWSKITQYEKYIKLQLDIRNKLDNTLSPIEWESKAWIAEAKNRNDNEQN